MADSSAFDLLVIGGGINGTAVALDAAGRGLKVCLCEKNDLASGTSSASSKLIHGGIRYLEQYEFKLVAESLRERDILLNKAPHLVEPLSFIMPDNHQVRSPLLVRLGLFLYDLMSGRQRLSKSKRLNLQNHPAGRGLKSHFKRGFSYSDCWTDDARLVVLNAIAAKEHGAVILTQTAMTAASKTQKHWRVTLTPKSGHQQTITAKAMVNAAGPWVDHILASVLAPSPPTIKHVKGSHIVVKKRYANEAAYLLQHRDNRVIFVIPYFEDYSLIGTTDVNYDSDLDAISPSAAETDYLCDVVNEYFTDQINASHVVWSFAGVRSLVNDHHQNPSEITRDYQLKLQFDAHTPPLLSVLGGKLTTHRRLAEDVCNRLKPFFSKMNGAWTSQGFLPGGNIPEGDIAAYKRSLEMKFPNIAPSLLSRYARCYGTRANDILKNVLTIKDLGQCYGANLYHQELLYLIKHEWVTCAEDLIWRRTKFGLYLSKVEVELLETTIHKIIQTEKLTN